MGAIGEPKREILIPTPDEAPRIPVREPEPVPPEPRPGVPVPAGG